MVIPYWNYRRKFELLATTDSIPVAGFKYHDAEVYAIQFHPEVTHSLDGGTLLKNFVVDICGCLQDWTPLSFIEETVEEIKAIVGNDHVVLGLSGGVDSSVAALLLHRAIGKQLTCIFVNNGLLRYKEFETVLDSYQHLGLNVIGVDASSAFYTALKGISEPEAKRKAIGKVFHRCFSG
jgi:GMP synthase (glutamine-hydrolysing)